MPVLPAVEQPLADQLPMSAPLYYHPGEIAVQQRAGAFEPADLQGNGLGTQFDDRAARFLAQQPWAILAARDPAGALWVSLLHGPPGFLKVEDPATLAIHASLSAADPLGDAFKEEAGIGLLVLDPQTRRRMRLNGWGRSEPGDILRVRAREVYGNCPKYIQRRALAGDANLPAEIPTIGSRLSSAQREWIGRSDTFFIGTRHAEAGVDCSHRGGQPGFVRAVDDQRIIFPDYAGNNMFQTLGNLTLCPQAGLLFLDFESGHVLQLSGKATVVWDAERLAAWPGAQRLIEFTVDAVQETPHASPLRWRLLDYSPFNPQAGAPT